MAQTLKFGNGTWATKKGSILAHNDEGGNFKPLPFTYTGAGKGTRVNKEGLIEVVENDRPRIDYLDSEDGVFLLENAATNLITYSEDVSHSSWAKTSVSITSNSILSPDGSLNASIITEDSTLNNHRISVNGLVGSGTHTVSVFAKANDRNWLIIRNAANNAWFDVLNGVVGTVESGNGSIESYGNGWYRCSVTMSSLSTPAVGIADNNGSYSYQGNGTGSLYIWGAVAEQNSVASSYIPTQGTIQTRVQETASGSGNSEVFNDSQGILFANIAALTEIDTYRAISISSGSDNDRMNIWYWNNGRFKIDLHSGAILQYNFGFDANMTAFNKIAFKYKQNDFCVFHNGFKIGIDTSGITPVGLSELSFDRANGAFPFYGKTKEIAYYDEILTDLELETLTSYRTWEEMVKELNLNIIHNE
jgi:hypothetical protein